MVKPLGVVAMLTLLISGQALADDHISKDDVKQITFTKKSIIFRMNDDTYLRGITSDLMHVIFKKVKDTHLEIQIGLVMNS